MSEITIPTNTSTFSVALVGNPNVGKTTIFNRLTGLRQKVGNYPGVTVDKRRGAMQAGHNNVTIIDLPGTYSIYPNTEDEIIVHRVLNGLDEENQPDFVLAIVDMSSMERGLFLVSQVMDLGLPMAIVLNMEDTAENQGIVIKTHQLYKALGVPIIQSNARSDKSLKSIEELITNKSFAKPQPFLNPEDLLPDSLANTVNKEFNLANAYQAFQLIRFHESEVLLKKYQKDFIREKIAEANFDLKEAQVRETKLRYKAIQDILKQCTEYKDIKTKKLTQQLDKIFLHKVGGYVVFLGVLLLIFQAIFAWSTIPMDLIDGFFASFSGWVYETMPAGVLTDLIAEGIIPGIGGVLIFIPQIALLFGFLAILEDSGYMSRVVFLMDRLMRPFGLNGKSMVPLISSVACAIPGIMAARNIGNWKDRITTIMVAPLMSCSARLPVYVILIALAVPDENVGPFNLQAIALLGMYLLGIVAVLLVSIVFKLILKSKEKSFLMLEMPLYRLPKAKDVAITMFTKSRTFVLAAGKIILAISVVLWVLASYGPSSRMEAAIASIEVPEANADQEVIDDYNSHISSVELENSYIGIAGKFIEPVIRPLGYDWKIGIALITSFAAREVFVSTIATLYSVGADVEDELTIREKMDQEVNPQTGEKVYNIATSFSLIVFYAFAMQCMSTLAVVYRETNGWKWPIIQTAYMTAMAYVSAWAVYQLLS
ncbi:MAG TPA: ferrous iron transport protein B [Cyclobacteriaceae bacterium]|nr:ferrous iron transport protein B [Cyclobacteriaceae bacterium]